MGAAVDEPPHVRPPNQSQSELPRVNGFWRTTVSNRGELVSWDIGCAALLTAVAVWRIQSHTLEKALPSLLTTEFGIVGALLGIVIAGLAIIVGFMSRDYAIVLVNSKGGPEREFWPFWFVAAPCGSFSCHERRRSVDNRAGSSPMLCGVRSNYVPCELCALSVSESCRVCESTGRDSGISARAARRRRGSVGPLAGSRGHVHVSRTLTSPKLVRVTPVVFSSVDPARASWRWHAE
jgi:hypothetical protein